MSYWNATTREIVSFDDYPWCDDCGGTGRYARHERSGALALWPGGPFVGREPQERQT
jgi:hypothetical protein